MSNENEVKAEEKKPTGRPQKPNPYEQKAPLDSVAFSFAKDSTGHYVMVRIKYNVNTLDVGGVETERVSGDGYLDAEDGFRMMVARELFR